MIHKALRYKLICSVDHVIGQAISICFRVGGRVGKRYQKKFERENVELTIQNVWNRHTLAEKYRENFLYYDWLTCDPV